MVRFNPNILSQKDWTLASGIVGAERLTHPDLLIAPHDVPYLYRWDIIHEKESCVYFHIQVANDGGRQLHDHPWDNYSVILAGAYMETICSLHGQPDPGYTRKLLRKTGDVISRGAEQCHRLDLAPKAPYCITLFTTGPKKRDWGFWDKDGFVPFDKITQVVDGISRHTGERA